jgi:hypothetical protein
MKPRAAGLIGIVVALALAVLGGYLLAHPPWSIPGAIVLVLASVALSLSVVWTRMTSWAEPWPPHVVPSLRKQLRTAKVLLMLNCVALVAMIALTVVAISIEFWNQVYLGIFWIFLSATNVVTSRRRLRALLQGNVRERTE